MGYRSQILDIINAIEVGEITEAEITSIHEDISAVIDNIETDVINIKDRLDIKCVGDLSYIEDAVGASEELAQELY